MARAIRAGQSPSSVCARKCCRRDQDSLCASLTWSRCAPIWTRPSTSCSKSAAARSASRRYFWGRADMFDRISPFWCKTCRRATPRLASCSSRPSARTTPYSTRSPRPASPRFRTDGRLLRVAVLGAGVVGLATAHYLARDGHAVTVVDRNDGVGLETSYANGAQLSYSYVAPLAGPGVLPKIPPWLLRRDSPLRFYPALDVQQWRWLIEFVLACNRTRSDLTTRRLLALSFYSRRLMHAFIASEQIE